MQRRISAGVMPVVLLCAGWCTAPSGSAAPQVRGKFGAGEWKRSAIPLRPGEPGKAPFWNAYAKRFIYAPAFDFKPVASAVKYRFEIVSLKDSSTHRFESAVPWAPLSPVWVSVPVGNFDLKVTGLSARGESLGVAGEGRYFRAAPFDGPYHEAVIPYDKSARLALDKAMEKPFVQSWLTKKAPDFSYFFYRYSAKLYGSVVVAAVAHAKMRPGTEEAKRSTELARVVADYLIGIGFPAGTALEYFPPTYHGPRTGDSFVRANNYMIIVAADSGHAFLDLYDHTGDKKYLEAAKKIAQTYLKTQGEDGTWYLYVDSQTGAPTAPPKAIPTSTINYFERLKNSYGMEGLEGPIQRAFDWIMKNPVKTFHWLAQYEDVDSNRFATYQRLSREQACDLAIYLFKKYAAHPEYVKLAEDLIRFAEDQFLTWEQIEDFAVVKGRTVRPAPDPSAAPPGWYSRNWMTPVVHEQYGFWMPSARNTGLMIETYWHAYAATKKDVYLAKARSIANNFTRVQAVHNGEYPTMFTKYQMNYWFNNSIYPAKVMLWFHENLKKIGQAK